MTRKNNIEQSANKAPEPAKKGFGNWMVPAGVALICAGIFYWTMFGSGAPATQNGAAPNSSAPVANATPAQTPDAVPAFFDTSEAAKPYPETLDPAQFSNPDVAHAYRVAKEIPGVLAQQPCYCYCSVTAGHRALLDCWTDLHGSICDICVKEALLTERLNKLGLSPAQIRAAIMRGDWKDVNVEVN